MSELAVAIILVFVRHLAVSNVDGNPTHYKIGERVSKDKLKAELDPTVFEYVEKERYFKEVKGDSAEQHVAESPTGQSLSSTDITKGLEETPGPEGTDQTTTSPRVENITPVTGDGSSSGYVDDEIKVAEDVTLKSEGVTFNGTQEENKKVDGLEVLPESIGNPNSAVAETPIEGLEKEAAPTQEIEVSSTPTEVKVDNVPEIAKTDAEKAADETKPKAATVAKPKATSTTKPKDVKGSPFGG